MSLYCPRCDRRLAPDHRCLSRRVFLFGAMAGLIRPPRFYSEKTMAAIDKVIRIGGIDWAIAPGFDKPIFISAKSMCQFMGMPFRLDPTMPKNEIELRTALDRVRIVNLKEPG